MTYLLVEVGGLCEDVRRLQEEKLPAIIECDSLSVCFESEWLVRCTAYAGRYVTQLSWFH